MTVDYTLMVGLVQNLRANLCHLSRIVQPFNDDTSQMLDIINHMDTLTQQIEDELDAGDI